ncbi:MAG: hypothetical protein KR126chlam1_01511 [Chlamydiae bacterium]|nr:hypothetical protein [Chlamydiota bacterium]
MQLILLFSLFFLQAAAPNAQTGAKKLTLEKVKGIEAAAATSARSVMIIDPKDRAADYMKAFQLLKTEKSTAKVYFTIAGGVEISNVIEMTAMPGGTMVLFRYSTPQGVKFQAVEIEDILGIHHL